MKGNVQPNRLSGAGARILRQSPRVSKSDNGRYSLTASQYINVSSASCDKAAHGVVCEYEARIARFPWGQSYRALTAQSGFAGALLPTAIRAQARPIAVGNTGSARPIGLRRYGLCSPYRLAPIRALARLCAHCVARIHRVFFSTVWLALSSRKRLGHYAKSCIGYGYPTSSSSRLSSIDCLRMCIELHRRRHERHGQRRRSHRPKTCNMD